MSAPTPDPDAVAPTDEQIDADLRVDLPYYRPDEAYPEHGHDDLRAAFRSGVEWAARFARPAVECCCEVSPPEFGGPLPDRDCPEHGSPRPAAVSEEAVEAIRQRCIEWLGRDDPAVSLARQIISDDVSTLLAALPHLAPGQSEAASVDRCRHGAVEGACSSCAACVACDGSCGVCPYFARTAPAADGAE